jgi:hypothetical protein
VVVVAAWRVRTAELREDRSSEPGGGKLKGFAVNLLNWLGSGNLRLMQALFSSWTLVGRFSGPHVTGPVYFYHRFIIVRVLVNINDLTPNNISLSLFIHHYGIHADQIFLE